MAAFVLADALIEKLGGDSIGRFADAALAYGRAVALGRTDLAPRLEEARRLGR